MSACGHTLCWAKKLASAAEQHSPHLLYSQGKKSDHLVPTYKRMWTALGADRNSKEVKL